MIRCYERWENQFPHWAGHISPQDQDKTHTVNKLLVLKTVWPYFLRCGSLVCTPNLQISSLIRNWHISSSFNVFQLHNYLPCVRHCKTYETNSTPTSRYSGSFISLLVLLLLLCIETWCAFQLSAVVLVFCLGCGAVRCANLLSAPPSRYDHFKLGLKCYE